MGTSGSVHLPVFMRCTSRRRPFTRNTPAIRTCRDEATPGGHQPSEDILTHHGRRVLLIGGFLTGIAALLHLAIIWGGPSWFQLFGSGERIARMAARGSVYPAVGTAGSAATLGAWALYAFSGAGFIRPLTCVRLVLRLIAAVYLARGILGIPVVL